MGRHERHETEGVSQGGEVSWRRRKGGREGGREEGNEGRKEEGAVKNRTFTEG